MTDNGTTNLTERDELLLERFFSEARRQEVADRGFSRRVMNRLPDRKLRLSRLWTAFCVLLFVGLFTAMGGWVTLVADLEAFVRTAPTELTPLPLLIVMATIMTIGLADVMQRVKNL